MTLADYLAQQDAHFDPAPGLVGHAAATPGYHTQVRDGTWVHSTLGNLDYALTCLATRAPRWRRRAAAVIATILDHQDPDPASRTYGIWPWFVEEPLAAMQPPDWNWADFCGARLAMMLDRHERALPAELVTRMRAALGHAARAIIRRDVGPGYTNIAIMGATVAAAAGELLDAPDLLDYGRARFARNVAHTRWHGGFNEYNSPTYTMVALAECDRALDLVRDPAVRADAERLRRVAWRTIAEHFHPGTGQWAGPHSRCYADRLAPATVELLSRLTRTPLAAHGVLGGQGRTPGFSFLRQRLCPPVLRPRFAALPAEQVELRRRFIRCDNDAESTWGTTWLSTDACLGSVNRDVLWVQRRPLLAYWRTPDDPAVVLRLRCLKDGRDFAAGAVTTTQHGPRALSVLGFARGMGDFHVSLDRPADGCYEACELVFRYELSGQGVDLEAYGTAYALRAGGWQAVVQPLATPGVIWRPGGEAGRVWVEARVYRGPRRRFGPDELAAVAYGAALELLPRGERYAPAPTWHDGVASWRAGGEVLTASTAG